MPSPTKRTSHDSRGHSFSQHHAQPPAYWSEQGHDAYDYDDDDEAVRRPTSKAPLSLIPGGLDSSRAIANGGEAQANGAGVGAGRNAYLAPDTPSMYTDPYEYSSTVVGGSKRPAGANVVSTRPDANFLAHDPYGGGPTQEGGLERSNTVGTLGPGDSISAYNVNAVSRNMGNAGGPRQQPSISYDAERYQTGPYSYGGHQGPDESRDFYDPSYHGHGGYEASYPDHGAYEGSRDDIPLRNYPGGMGYADDGYNDAKQREAYWNGDEREHNEQKNPPSLFANNLQDPPLPRKSVEDGGEDRKGLLGALPWASKEGTRAGWGGTLEDQIERRRKGVGRQRWPILTWLLAIAYVVVFIVELIKAKAQTGQAIQTSPSWNPMLGPSFEFLISFGARFVPCMRVVPDIPTSTELACLQYSTASSLTTAQQCPIWELCGLPDASTTGQAYRFVTPIFLHAGFIHIGFNLLVQLTLCAQIEKLLSTPFYAIIYMAGGIGGNLLGGNFGLVGQPSVGASGAIYTCISLELVDLCYNWRYVSGKESPRGQVVVLTLSAPCRSTDRVCASLCRSYLPSLVLPLGSCPAWTTLRTLVALPWVSSAAPSSAHRSTRLASIASSPGSCASSPPAFSSASVSVAASREGGAYLTPFPAVVGLGTNFYSSEDPNKACTWCRYLSWCVAEIALPCASC